MFHDPGGAFLHATTTMRHSTKYFETTAPEGYNSLNYLALAPRFIIIYAAPSSSNCKLSLRTLPPEVEFESTWLEGTAFVYAKVCRVDSNNEYLTGITTFIICQSRWYHCLRDLDVVRGLDLHSVLESISR